MSAELHYALRTMAPSVYRGTIVATTTKNNHDTATPFLDTGSALKGKTLYLQTDADCRITFGTADTVTAATSGANKGFHFLATDGMKSVTMQGDYGWIAVVSDSGTANVDIFEAVGGT